MRKSIDRGPKQDIFNDQVQIFNPLQRIMVWIFKLISK